MQDALDLRGDRLADLVDAAKATGAIDPALDTEAVVRFCHAVGFGFLLFRRRRRSTCPSPAPWEHLIARLVDALDATGTRPTTAPPTTTD